MSAENGKVCCNCRHDIRYNVAGTIQTVCDIDNHYIGYVQCFEGWCRHWARETKWDKEVTNK